VGVAVARLARPVLVVVSAEDELTRKSLRNVAGVRVLGSGQLNTYDVLASDHVVFTQAALGEFVTRATGEELTVVEPAAKPTAPAKPKRASTAKKAESEAAAEAEAAEATMAEAEVDEAEVDEPAASAADEPAASAEEPPASVADEPADGTDEPTASVADEPADSAGEEPAAKPAKATSRARKPKEEQE